MSSIMNNKNHYFSYLDIEGAMHFIKDMHETSVISKVLLMKEGDTFNIRGLGLLRIAKITYVPYRDQDAVIKEVGFKCERLDA
ncbi:hypothetical protein EDO6_06670 [Paenibacillus xylanexedens]|nr:hypothetical protein EDO6_06670 [Paenibacillus xylanexedens]